MGTKGLPFRCDDPTEDKRNCFPYSIMQQLRRSEVRPSISEEMVNLPQNCHALRLAVVDFVRNISPLSEFYGPMQEAIINYRQAIGGTWEERLENMSRDGY